MTFTPPTNADPYYQAAAHELMRTRLEGEPGRTNLSVAGAIRDETSGYQILIALAKEIGGNFPYAAEHGPVGIRTAQVASGILGAYGSALHARLTRETRSAGQLIGAGGRGQPADFELAHALALAVVDSVDGVNAARRVARSMLDVLALEPIEPSTPERPSSDV